MLAGSMAAATSKGTLSGYEQELSGVKLDKLISKDCTLIGAAGTPNMGRKILDMLKHGLIDLAPMLTEHYPFERAMLPSLFQWPASYPCARPK